MKAAIQNMRNNWDVQKPNEGDVRLLCDDLGIPRLLACSLVSRGISDPDEAERFLTPSLERDWKDPLSIPGLSEVVDVLEDAVRRQRRTLIFGDFDADGITASAVMLLGLRACGLEAHAFIPRRQDEGYGLSCEAIDRIMGLSHNGKPAEEPPFIPPPELVVTVDCGITGAREVDYILSLGLDAAVTDHHNPQDDMPIGIPVCNPRLDPDCPSGDLAGVGVALKVIQVLGSRFNKPGIWRGLVDLAAIGTIADRMPLWGENRALVAAGMKMIRENPRPGIMRSLELAGDDAHETTSTSLSFSLIPRINAAGRVADASKALDLLLCTDPLEAMDLAAELEEINTQRRQAEVELSDCAEEAIASQYHGGRVLVLANEGWHEGVKGIVASRLANCYGVPTILFTVQDGMAHGSGRSVGSVDLFEAVSQASDLVESFGGHKYAVGVTVRFENIDAFRTRLEEYFEKLPAEEFVSSIEVDGTLDFDDLTMEQVESLSRLEPFGQDNLEPLFCISDAFINRARAVGAKKNHLSFSITNGVSDAAAIYFHCDETDEYSSFAAPVDLVFSVQVEEYRGRRQIKLKVKDMVPSTQGDRCDHADLISFLDELYEGISRQRDAARPVNPGYSQPVREEEAVWILPTDDEEHIGSYDINQELSVALTGKRELKLHPAQRRALECLDDGKSTLAVMATGRGKSLIFYIHAAKAALMDGMQSIFVYPLRSLVNDQCFHIGQCFARLGMTVQILTGETPKADREMIYESWSEGETDVILTTPEFLSVHRDRIYNSGCVGFIAVDEAHHIAQDNEMHRPVYSRLGFIKERFPHATVLAVTATAPDEVADTIVNTLGLSEIVVDPTVRTNLILDDRRAIQDRATYLATLAAKGEKMLVYVNSRQSSIDVARMLRKRLPDMAMQIGFYNACLSRDARLKVESLFRDGELTVVVATSAFGEGVSISDVRHVVLYHMPFNPLSYNQMSGRCGRDGRPAEVHLLFDEGDASINRELMRRYCPTREELKLLYKVTRQRNDVLGRPVSEDELLDACLLQGARMTVESVRSAMAVFTELGLADSKVAGGVKVFKMHSGSRKVDLESSARYREAHMELESFDGFAKWLMEERADSLLEGVNRPLIPRG